MVFEAMSKFWRDQSGATAIEYSLIAAFIAVGIVTVVGRIGVEVQVPFVEVEAGFKKRSVT